MGEESKQDMNASPVIPVSYRCDRRSANKVIGGQQCLSVVFTIIVILGLLSVICTL